MTSYIKNHSNQTYVFNVISPLSVRDLNQDDSQRWKLTLQSQNRSRANPLDVFTLLNELFFLSGLKVSELFHLTQDADGPTNPKTGPKRVQGASPPTPPIHFSAPAVAHYQNLPVNNETRQWHRMRTADMAHGSVLSCRNWWDNSVHILYIQVKVLFYEPNWISALLSGRFKSTACREQSCNLRQFHRHIKSPFVLRGCF